MILGLKQLIITPTRITRESKTLIDVICSNVPHNISSVKVIPAGLSDHELIGCAIITQFQRSSYRNFELIISWESRFCVVH